jgi:hypothetical protein
MNYFIVTTSIIPKLYCFDNNNVNYDENNKAFVSIEKYNEERILQYINGFSKLKEMIQKQCLEKYKIIIIENNGKRETFLDYLDCDVFYTNNNSYSIEKGYKEIRDILDCIKQYNIKDTDFIIKMTGRYILHDNSEFMNVLTDDIKYDCIIKYGSYDSLDENKKDECISGLIGMRCIYIRLIENLIVNDSSMDEIIEKKWAKIASIIDDQKIYKIKILGIYVCPGSNTYYLV